MIERIELLAEFLDMLGFSNAANQVLERSFAFQRNSYVARRESRLFTLRVLPFIIAALYAAAIATWTIVSERRRRKDRFEESDTAPDAAMRDERPADVEVLVIPAGDIPSGALAGAVGGA